MQQINRDVEDALADVTICSRLVSDLPLAELSIVKAEDVERPQNCIEKGHASLACPYMYPTLVSAAYGVRDSAIFCISSWSNASPKSE